MLSYEAILSQLNENLVFAKSGREALQLLLKHDFALILLDVVMPDLDGFETADLIRQHPRLEQVPIIFVTAISFSELDRLKGYELGAVDYVFVPVIPEILRAKVSAFLELYRKNREALILNQALAETNAALERRNADFSRLVVELRSEISQRKQAQGALIDQEKYFRSLIENASDIITLLNKEGRILYQSNSLERVLGYTPQEMLGKNAFTYVHQDDRKLVQERLAAVVQNPGQPQTTWFRFLHKDGSWRILESLGKTLSPISADDGVVVNSRDITQRKRAETELRKNTSLLEEAQKMAHLGSWEWDIAIDSLIWSEELYRIHGVTPEEFGGTFNEFLDLVHPKDREKIKRIIGNAIVNPKPFQYYERVLLPDNSVRLLYSRGRIEVDSKGEPVKIVGICQDVTKERTRVLALRQSERKFRALLESAPDAMVIVDEQGKIVLSNLQTEELFGYTRDELLGEPVEMLIPKRFGERHIEHRARYHAESQVRPMGIGLELYGQRKDGSEFPVEISLSPIVTEKGTLVTSAIRDVTARKQAEQEMQLLLTISQAMNESENINDALGVVTTKVVEATQWDYGESWVPSGDGTVLECCPIWYCRSKELERLGTWSANLKFAKNKGLPGEVWAWKRPKWEKPISESANLLRAEIMAELGIKAGLGVPIVAGDDVVAVLVFFLLKTSPQDEHLIEIVTNVAVQLGAIVQKRRMEAALRETEQRFRLLTTGVREYAIFMLNPKGHVATWNEGAERIKGYKKDEILGQHFSIFYTREDLEAGLPERGLAKALSHGQYENTGWRLRKDGSLFWAEVMMTAIYDESGTLLGFSKITRDSTEQKRIAEALVESEEKFRGLVEGLPDAIIVEQNQRIVYVNPTGLRLLGVETLAALEQRTLDDIFHQTPDTSEKPLSKETSPRESSIEGAVICRDGTQFDVEITFMQTGYYGQPAMLALARDITEKKQLREEAQRMKRLAELGEFAMVVSHEIRNPLGAISLNFEYLSKRLEIAPAYQKKIHDIRVGLTRIEKIIKNVLDFSHPLPMDSKLIEIHKVLDSSVDLYRDNFQQSGVEFIKNYGAHKARVNVDANQIIQVFGNLFINARDAMPSGGTITISTALNNKHLEVAVEDTGSGIPENVRYKIFDPFSTTKTKGTGLGLSIVRRILDQHRARILVESQPNKGAKFRIDFPLP